MDIYQGCVLFFGLVCWGPIGLVDCGYVSDYAIEMRLQNLEEREKDHIQITRTLQNKVKEQSQMIKELEETVKAQTAIISGLQEKMVPESQSVKSQTQENKDLKALMENQRNEIGELKELVKLVMKDMDSASLKYTADDRNENNTKSLGLLPKGVAVHQDMQVAFHAKFLYWNAGPTKVGQRISFDIIMLNIGDAYTYDGVFRAPVDGLYFFSVSICMLHEGKEIRAELIKSGKRIAGAYAKGFNQGSISVVVPLVRNDTVWVSAWNNPGTYLYDSSLNSFMGYRIAGY